MMSSPPKGGRVTAPFPHIQKDGAILAPVQSRLEAVTANLLVRQFAKAALGSNSSLFEEVKHFTTHLQLNGKGLIYCQGPSLEGIERWLSGESHVYRFQ